MGQSALRLGSSRGHALITASDERTLASAAAFLRSQTERLNFGEVEVRLVIHGGKIARIEKGTIEKEQAGSDDPERIVR